MAGTPQLTVDQAIVAIDGGRHRSAFRALKAWAELGHSDAYHMLGLLYDVGEGTRRNRARAIYWYTRAYESGGSMAASNLATIYRDSGQAKLEFSWYQRAAQLGDGDALVELGIRYLSGKGVRRDVKKAVSAFKRALRHKRICEASVDTARQLLWGTVRSARVG